MNNHITVIVKTTDACNLRCTYCYNDHDNYANRRIDVATFERLLSVLIKEYSKISFIWHGGEPLLMGIPFYEECMELQEKYANEKNVVFRNSLQTNATLIDDTWCDLFKKYKIKVGVSFDGPPWGTSGRGGTKEARAGMDCLKKRGISFGAIAVINSNNLQYIDKIYDYFNEEKISYSMNCVFESGKAAKNQDILIDKKIYIDKMIELYERWCHDASSNITVDPFNEILDTIVSGPSKCEYTGCMYKFIAINHAGDIFPCGRFFLHEHKMGNIRNVQCMEDIWENDNYNSIVRMAISRRNKCRNECHIYKYCNGGCNANAFCAGDMTANSFPECENYKILLLHIKNSYDKMIANKSLPSKIKNYVERRKLNELI